MSRSYKIIRQPDGYRESDSNRNIQKWNKVITLFYEEKIDELKPVYPNRILSSMDRTL